MPEIAAPSDLKPNFGRRQSPVNRMAPGTSTKAPRTTHPQSLLMGLRDLRKPLLLATEGPESPSPWSPLGYLKSPSGPTLTQILNEI